MVFKKGQISLWKGKKMPEELKRRLYLINKGSKHTEEHKKKISESCKGLPSKRKGKKFGRQKYPFKNGRKNNRKYFMILQPEHPFCNKNGYIYEHRLIMENHLGRYLTPKEIIHHIDENPSNNSIENLKLCKNNAEHRRLHKKTI